MKGTNASRKSHRARKPYRAKRTGTKVYSRRKGRKGMSNLKKLIKEVAIGTQNLKTVSISGALYLNTVQISNGEGKACYCLTSYMDLGGGNTSTGVWPAINTPATDNALASDEGYFLQMKHTIQMYNSATQNAAILPLKGFRVIIFSPRGSNFINTAALGPGIVKWNTFLSQTAFPDLWWYPIDSTVSKDFIIKSDRTYMIPSPSAIGAAGGPVAMPTGLGTNDKSYCEFQVVEPIHQKISFVAGVGLGGLPGDLSTKKIHYMVIYPIPRAPTDGTSTDAQLASYSFRVRSETSFKDSM